MGAPIGACPRRGRWTMLVAASLLGCTTATLRSGLDEPEADRILVALDAASVLATKLPEHGALDGARYRVEVAAGDAPHALRVLAEMLPDRPQPGFAELYAKPGLVPTLGEDRARWSQAIAGELARSIRDIPGVHDARVHLAIADPVDGALDREPFVPRASVLVTRRANAAPIDERALRALVSGAVDGLSPDRVSVVQAVTEAGGAQPSRVVGVGPSRLLAASAPALKLALGGALALDALLAIALIALVVNRRR